MRWTLHGTAGGDVSEPHTFADAEEVLEVVVLGLGQERPFSLSFTPVTDGGWTEAPAPTTTWNPVAVALDGTQSLQEQGERA